MAIAPIPVNEDRQSQQNDKINQLIRAFKDIGGLILLGILDNVNAKTTPVDADLVPLVDSEDSNSLKKLSWANIKATLKTYFDTLYAAAGSGMAAATYDPQGIEDDAFDVDNHTDGTTNKVYPATDKTKLSNIEASADVTDAANVGSSIHGADAKASLVDADKFAIIDSAASNVLKTSLWSVIKSTLVTYLNDTGVLTAFQAAGSYLTASNTATLTNKTIDANGTGNSISNLETADFASNVVDTDGTFAADSDTRLPSQKATKTYVDGKLANLGQRGRVRAATTADVTISTALNDGDTLDGVTLADGDRVLVKNQSAPAENGIYVVGDTPARAGDYDDYDDFPASLQSVAEGTTNADTVWLCTSNTGGTIGSTALAFAKQSMSGELLAANNLSDLADAATARGNLGAAASATTVTGAGLATGGGDLSANRTITVTEASEGEAQAGTATDVALTPRRFGAALLSLFGPTINGGTAKSTPVGGDMIGVGDSAASWATKSVTLTAAFAQFMTIASTLLAAASDLWAATADRIVTAASLTAGHAIITVTPSTATFTPNQNSGTNFLLTLADNSTLAMMSNLKNGRGGTIWVVQDGSGTNTLDVSAYMTSATIEVATGANEITILGYQTNQAGDDVALWLVGADFA